MDFQYLYQSPSGLSGDAFSYLGQRFEKGRTFAVGFVDTWVLENASGRDRVRCGLGGWYTMLWRSLEGRLYASQAEGYFHVFREANGRLVSDRFPVPGAVMGVWGLSDACVYTWSLDGDSGRLFLWDGKRLQEIPSPGKIVRIHGLSTGSLLAVGQDGLVARWNGTRWHRFQLPTTETFTGVFAAGPDAFFAVGLAWTVVEGTSHGCRIRARAPGPLYDVAAWGGEVWIAANELGLFCLEQGQPAVRKQAPIPALSFDARGDLLVGCSDFISTTVDGKVFTKRGDGALAAGIAARPPLWFLPSGATVTL